jgi:hypothetical protein
MNKKWGERLTMSLQENPFIKYIIFILKISVNIFLIDYIFSFILFIKLDSMFESAFNNLFR